MRTKVVFHCDETSMIYNIITDYSSDDANEEGGEDSDGDSELDDALASSSEEEEKTEGVKFFDSFKKINATNNLRKRIRDGVNERVKKQKKNQTTRRSHLTLLSNSRSSKRATALVEAAKRATSKKKC